MFGIAGETKILGKTKKLEEDERVMPHPSSQKCNVFHL
jgi:hypothetical protein